MNGWARRNSQGFTLLEVLIAMAILAMFMVPLLGTIIGGMGQVRAAKNREIALRLAQDKMSELEMTVIPEEEGDRTGDFGRDYPDYKWRVELIKSPDLQFVEDNFGVKAREVYLHVIWNENGGEKSITLATILFLEG